MPLPRSAPVIASLKNPRVKAVAALRDRKAREAAGRSLVDGVRELSRAVRGGAAIEEVWVDEGSLDPDGRAVVEAAVASGAALVRADALVLARLAYGDRSEGVVGVVRIPALGLDGLRLGADPLLVVLEGVEKPGNLGAVLRTADAAGADAVIAADARSDLFNPNAIRASLGTVFSVPVASAGSAEVLAWLVARGVRVLAARVDADASYAEADLRGPVALVLGSEADGLTDVWSGAAVERVSLPMLGIGDSLNVSITAAVLLYEARRQRGMPPGHALTGR